MGESGLLGVFAFQGEPVRPALAELLSDKGQNRLAQEQQHGQHQHEPEYGPMAVLISAVPPGAPDSRRPTRPRLLTHQMRLGVDLHGGVGAAWTVATASRRVV